MLIAHLGASFSSSQFAHFSLVLIPFLDLHFLTCEWVSCLELDLCSPLPSGWFPSNRIKVSPVGIASQWNCFPAHPAVSQIRRSHCSCGHCGCGFAPFSLLRWLFTVLPGTTGYSPSYPGPASGPPSLSSEPVAGDEARAPSALRPLWPPCSVARGVSKCTELNHRGRRGGQHRSFLRTPPPLRAPPVQPGKTPGVSSRCGPVAMPETAAQPRL